MYRFIKLISLVILIIIPSTYSYAVVGVGEILWGTDTAGGGGGGGGSWDAEINVATSTQPCVDINNAIADAMDSETEGFTRVRVHMGTAESFAVTVETDYEDLGPYKACIALLPTLNAASGYPVPADLLDWRTVLQSKPSRLYLYFDNIRPLISQAGMTENGVFLEVGNGFLAGHSDIEPPVVNQGVWYGRLGENVVIAGQIHARISVQNDAGWDDRVLPVGGDTARLNRDHLGAHLTLGAGAATFTNMADLLVQIENQDDNDIFFKNSSSWGLLWPALMSQGSSNEGIGFVLHGTINNQPNSSTQLRQFDYGIVYGDPVYAGATMFYTGCAAGLAGGGGSCVRDVRDVRGANLEGITEGHTYALLVDIASGGQQSNMMYHECGGTSCQFAGMIFNPNFCDGVTGTGTLIPANVPAPVMEVQCASDNNGASIPPPLEGPGSRGFHRFSGPYSPRATPTNEGGLVTPAILLGERFDRFKGLSFYNGVQMGGDSVTKFVFTPDYSLQRPNFTECVGIGQPYPSCTGVQTGTGTAVASKSAQIGRVDLSGGHFGLADSKIPNYDNWFDTRETLLFETTIGTSLATVDWDRGPLPQNECVNNTIDVGSTTTGNTPQTVGIACTNSTLSHYFKWPTDVFVTRMSAMAIRGMTGGESCEVGLALDNYAAGLSYARSDFAAIMQVPPAPELMGGKQSTVIAVNQKLPIGNSLQISVGRGLYAPDGVTPPVCTSAAGGILFKVRVYGYERTPMTQ